MGRMWIWLSLALVSAPGSVSARSIDVVPFHYEQVWGAAVRLIRVDQGFRITDQDRDVGFVLFEYVRAGHRAQGSLEIVRVEQDGRPAVRVVVHLSKTPSYMERLLLDQLERKLRGDYGVPEAPRESAPEKAPERSPSSDSPEQDQESSTN
jgi:hypothetical protein